ncbi:MAG: methionine aminopeptidase, partial [Paludibacteraceae bacterium]|nr:methionine aminopeptidase [Paludibacteraceae bacterium]
MIFGKKKINWKVPKGVEPTEFDRKILNFQNRGFLVPKNELILNEEQIEGIRRSGVVNTGVLDAVAAAIRPGMTTQEIDDIVYQYTIDHGAIPACL